MATNRGRSNLNRMPLILAEIQNSKSERGPKLEIRNVRARPDKLPISALGFRSSFGYRLSYFGFSLNRSRD